MRAREIKTLVKKDIFLRLQIQNISMFKNFCPRFFLPSSNLNVVQCTLYTVHHENLNVFTFLPQPVSKPGHVAVAVEGVGDQVEGLQAGQLVKGARGHAAANADLCIWCSRIFDVRQFFIIKH